METPIPNFYFMGVQFVHLLALSIWLGGIVIIQTIFIPIRSETTPTGQLDRLFLGKIVAKFDHATLFCAGALVATSIIKFWRWETLTPWNLIRYFSISMMSFISLYTAIKISPKMLEGKVLRQSESTDRARAKLYRLSSQLMRINLIFGAAALLMA